MYFAFFVKFPLALVMVALHLPSTIVGVTVSLASATMAPVESLTVTLTSFSIKGDALVLGFAEISTPEEASAFYGQTLNLDKEQAPMPEGYVRYDELIGFNAIDDEGKKLGSLLDVLENAPTPSLKFKSVDGKVFYVPFIDAFVGEIDYQEKTIRIHVVEGML